jgi:excisionase family DNA binding protein
MTVHEVAAYLRVTTRTVTNLANDGTLPGIKCGKLWRFRRQTILSML